jgi:hypothetical protein
MYDFRIGADRSSAGRNPVSFSLSYETHDSLKSYLGGSGIFMRMADYYKDCQFHYGEFVDLNAQLTKLLREFPDVLVLADFADNFLAMIEEATVSSSHIFGIAD